MFLTPLRMTLVEEADGLDQSEWVLDSPLRYRSKHLPVTIDVPAGFRTDLASVPRVPVIWWLAGGIGNAASTVHDYLYRERKDIDRSVADAVFYEALQDSGVSRWRAWMMWAAVRVFGG